MLNITNNKLHKEVDLSKFKSGQKIFHQRNYSQFNRFLLLFAGIMLIILFLPWTQTVSGKGYLTTLRPDQRPQTVQSAIPGRIEKWFVQEGESVNQGDTILYMSEVRNEYFDPMLAERTNRQLQAKTGTVDSYAGKIDALQTQMSALSKERSLKLQQTRNKLLQAGLKVKSDSMELEASKTNASIADRQYERVMQLEKEGLKAVTDLEEKRMKMQEAQAKLISRQNQLLASRNELINAEVEISRIDAEYGDKISKAQSDVFTARSDRFDAEVQATKLENEYANYEIRSGLHYVRAPISGIINRALLGGVGETFKEGERLVRIMPTSFDRAVETYVEPIDMPLMHTGAKVRIRFDGWPAIVFSGWPNASYGTYGGEVVAMETFISENGKYRILVAPDPEEFPWPEEVRVGSGATTLALLDDVPIWFEIWRQLNGFPPNYYQTGQLDETAKK